MHYVALGLYRLVRVVKISSDLSRSDQSFPKYVGSSFCRKSSQDWNGIWTCILACLQCRRTMSVSLTILKCHRRLVSRIVYTCDILIHMWYSQCLEAISNYDLDLTLHLYRMTHKLRESGTKLSTQCIYLYLVTFSFCFGVKNLNRMNQLKKNSLHHVQKTNWHLRSLWLTITWQGNFGVKFFTRCGTFHKGNIAHTPAVCSSYVLGWTSGSCFMYANLEMCILPPLNSTFKIPNQHPMK